MGSVFHETDYVRIERQGGTHRRIMMRHPGYVKVQSDPNDNTLRSSSLPADG